ncbi:hypothetical protein BO71DRAFT_431285 [Aspergillus ellipticus CBS 707.79]|uniref:Helicase C-terminal domain-containing protein n=1 Tax=Aspergillus ellipticus CBS 707.79 TaxID=1448320 RepID=A0A319EQ60_9EURO|nr:hypothetical protein BO71DRAFT_431285 [Aspergillus ellipticus CBS 707.79]
MVLVMLYMVNSAGLNLQKMCRNVHLFSVALNLATTEQAIGRTNRCGQAFVVQVFDYRVPDTFQISLSKRATQKALPAILTDMSSSLAAILNPTNDYVEASRWVIRDKELIYVEDGDVKEDTDIDDPDRRLDAIMVALEGGEFEDKKKTRKRQNMGKKKRGRKGNKREGNKRGKKGKKWEEGEEVEEEVEEEGEEEEEE